ncbi:MAG TPA: hypothetical protein PKI20_01070 [Verrucomicrobiota bacterium]|nr:hypothetical protein [Verrucomicrobiota bacterium]HQL77288.1 hypothetical protein [Verrucomicrobiota bacterium]
MTTRLKRAWFLMLVLALFAPAARAQISWQGQGDAFQVGGLTPAQWSVVAQAGLQGAWQGFDNVADVTSGISQDAASFVADLMTLVFWDPGAGGPNGPSPSPDPYPMPTPPDPDQDNDSGLDFTCPGPVIDLRPPGMSDFTTLTVTVPWFKYRQCTRSWMLAVDNIVCCCMGGSSFGPGTYTRTDSWQPSRGQCWPLPDPYNETQAHSSGVVVGLHNFISVGDNYLGGVWSIWGCLAMSGNATCNVPCRQSGITDSCYDNHGAFCGLTIYAFGGWWCTHYAIGQVSRTITYLLPCSSPEAVQIPVDTLPLRVDASLVMNQVAPEEWLFSTTQPRLYGGMSKGVVRKQGRWWIFTPDANTPIVSPGPYPLLHFTPSEAMTEAAKYNPSTWSQTWALLCASELAPVVALNSPPREVVPGQEYAEAVPDVDNTDPCFPISFYDVENTPPFLLIGQMSQCSPQDHPQMFLAAIVDTNVYDNFHLSSSDAVFASMLSTNPLIPYDPNQSGGDLGTVAASQNGGLWVGYLVITNLFDTPLSAQEGLNVALLGRNKSNGANVASTLSLKPYGNRSMYVTNDFVTLGVTNQIATVTFNFDVLLSDTNSFNSGGFGWANGGVATNTVLPYAISQGGTVVPGTITAPQTGLSVPYVTDQAGEVVFTLFLPCGTNHNYSTNVVLNGGRQPLIELYSFYPDPVNLRLLTNDVSPSTVRYRIINPLPGEQTVCYTNTDLESGAIKDTGCFSNAFAEVTTDTRLTSMTAIAVPQAGLRSAAVSRQARILVETPLVSLPPILHNSLGVIVTNKTQTLKACQGELFRLDLMNQVEELSNIFYPDNGLLTMELDGNNTFDSNQVGSWTNRFSNTALTDNWFQQGDVADPPVLQSGCSYAGTRFDVGDLQVSTTTGNNGLAAITASTITTNATLLLQQTIDGTNWTTASTIPASSGTFTNVNLGWPTRLVGTKDLYNPAFHSVDRSLFMNAAVDDCLGLLRITANAAVTNLSITGSSYGTNIDLSGAPNRGFLTESLGLPNDTYEIVATGYGPPVISTNTLTGNLSYDLTLFGAPSDQFFSRRDPESGTVTYYLSVSGATNPVIQLSSGNTNLQFSASQGGHVTVLGPRTVQLLLGNLSQIEFSTMLSIENPPCPNITIPLGVYRGGTPAFDIPVSDNNTGNCLSWRTGGMQIWTGPPPY